MNKTIFATFMACIFIAVLLPSVNAYHNDWEYQGYSGARLLHSNVPVFDVNYPYAYGYDAHRPAIITPQVPVRVGGYFGQNIFTIRGVRPTFIDPHLDGYYRWYGITQNYMWQRNGAQGFDPYWFTYP